MVSRMDRYKDEASNLSRYEKNKEFYENLGSNTKYTNIEEVTNSNAYEIDINNNKVNSRSEYQKIKEYKELDNVPKVKKELDNFNFLYNTKEKKIYDINRVIEEAHNNRVDKEIEEKRKLKDNSYNILLSLDKESLEEYKKKRNDRLLTKEEEDIHDFIDTITTKTLTGEIDKDTSVSLLSDLMATNVFDRVDNNKEIEKEESEEKLEKEIEEEPVAQLVNNDRLLTEEDEEFYTKSVKINEDDLEMDNELVEKHMPLLLKIILIILILVAILIGGYFIYTNFF